MANVLIVHSDGRRFDVSEEAFKDLYEPNGFTVEGVYVNGTVKPDTEANRAKANDAPEAKPFEQTVREHMARTDMQTNGASAEDAAKAYGLDVKDLKAPKAETEAPAVIKPNGDTEAKAPAGKAK